MRAGIADGAGHRRLTAWSGSRIPLLRTDRMGPSRSRATGGGGGSWAGRSRRRGPPAEKGRPKPGRDADARPAGWRINVNTATEAELEALPGVGPVIARRIIEGRPYRSVEDLERVKGIGKKRLEEIRPLAMVE